MCLHRPGARCHQRLLCLSLPRASGLTSLCLTRLRVRAVKPISLVPSVQVSWLLGSPLAKQFILDPGKVQAGPSRLCLIVNGTLRSQVTPPAMARPGKETEAWGWEWLAQSLTACWRQSLGLIQVPDPQDRAGSVISLRSRVCPPLFLHRERAQRITAVHLCLLSLSHP